MTGKARHWRKDELCRHIQNNDAGHDYLGRVWSFSDLFAMPLELLEQLHAEQHQGRTHGPDGELKQEAS